MTEQEIEEKVREYRKFKENIFSQFLDIEEQHNYSLSLSPYDLCREIYMGNKGNWKRVPFINYTIGGELREVINRLNSWCSYLNNWSIWLQVLSKHNEDEAWNIRSEFVDSLVFFCMFQPSAIRDVLCFIATSAIHQTNLELLPDYKDKLDSDNKNKNKNNITLSRKQAEDQLIRLGHKHNWETFNIFYEKLICINSKEYQKVTRNFRNLASHKIAPHFELGEVSFIHRFIKPKTEPILQTDGTYKFIETNDKVVSYSFGGIPPLNLKEMYDANKKEYKFGSA